MSQLAFLCIATFHKGQDFLRACKALGHTVYLLTDQKLAGADWPHEAIDEVFYLSSPSNAPQDLEQMLTGLAHAMRSRRIDRVVALDDFDVEKGALIRETFRIDGMGQTTARYFRDKLAMRTRAAAAGIRVPAFSPIFHDETVTHFLQTTEAPWLIKPRAEASTTGIRKVHSLDEAWQVIHSLGDTRHQYLIECFKPGRVYHVDALSLEGKAVFTRISQYVATPMEVAHGGGIFRTGTLPDDTPEVAALRQFNNEVLEAFGMRHSASHSEYIRGDHDGELYFLETACRVGGAHIAEMVEAASGVNLWREWAKLETAVARKEHYLPPVDEPNQAGLIISLARQQWPDLSGFVDEEIWWRMNKEYHIGLIVRSTDRTRILTLLDDYMKRIHIDFHASAPVPDKATS
ncbi:ATP-grasp domain-containing protein [Spirosoma utsteinense]|uniref:Biotin carboxylase n=1 Tax=Spirosoma utsteinense TaxID=2585773 RepID=A0ABR6W4G5_9BACT|nr:ATPase [Spirosoma utsteinense]MBC3787093.1 biotin carboxylase [Spirosoma utsteinense]MBC3791357.1 biotin carboxylase [Spirosoma utsteinense]